jgi:hypothetical protein
VEERTDVVDDTTGLLVVEEEAIDLVVWTACLATWLKGVASPKPQASGATASKERSCMIAGGQQRLTRDGSEEESMRVGAPTFSRSMKLLYEHFLVLRLLRERERNLAPWCTLPPPARLNAMHLWSMVVSERSRALCREDCRSRGLPRSSPILLLVLAFWVRGRSLRRTGLR